MYYPLQFVMAFFGSYGFALIYNSPRKSVYKSSIIGAIGWTIYKFCLHNKINVVIACFLAAFVIGSLSEYCATYQKMPAINFFLPAIIPLVPGAGMYYTMFNLVSKNYDIAAAKGVETFFVAVAIAVGVYVASNIAGNVRNFKFRKY